MLLVKYQLSAVPQNVYQNVVTVSPGYTFLVSGVYTSKVEEGMHVRFRIGTHEAIVMRYLSKSAPIADISPKGFVVAAGDVLECTHNINELVDITVVGQLVPYGLCV